MIEIAKLKRDVESKEKNGTEILKNIQSDIKDMAINITALNEKTKALEDIKAELKEMNEVISQEGCRGIQVLHVRNDIKEEFAWSHNHQSSNGNHWMNINIKTLTLS